jgi:hypothetical protein
MSYTILAAAEADFDPVNSAGEQYLHVLDRPEDSVYADTVTDICETLIPGYDELDHTPDGDAEALVLRYDASVVIADDIQEQLLAQASADSKAQLSDEDLALVQASRHKAVRLDSVWEKPVPLILISTHYAPYTELPAPDGEIGFINPHSEVSFLESTSQLGIWNYTDLRKVPDEEPIGLDD